jgi:hypothetical protein
MTTDETTQTTARRRRWSKRKLWLVGAGVPLATAGTVAAAAAIFAAIAGVQGTGQTGDFTAKWAAMTPVLDTTALTVQPQGAASISGGQLVLPALTMYPGESFTVEGPIVSGAASQAGYVSGATLPGLPSGYSVEVVSGCGAKVTPSMQQVKLKVTAPAAQTPGASWTLAADAGVRVTPLASATSNAPGGVTCPVWLAP